MSKLMRAINRFPAPLMRSPLHGLPCCLETQTECNVKFYEKHGFEVASVGEPRGLRVWTMHRSPQGPRTAIETQPGTLIKERT